MKISSDIHFSITDIGIYGFYSFLFPLISSANFIKMGLTNLLIFSKKKILVLLIFSVYLNFQFYLFPFIFSHFLFSYTLEIYLTLLFKLWNMGSKIIYSFKPVSFLLGTIIAASLTFCYVVYSLQLSTIN